jgi:hypothetical protein
VTNAFTAVSDTQRVFSEALLKSRETPEMLDNPMLLPNKVKEIDPEDGILTECITLPTGMAEDIVSVILPCLNPTEKTILLDFPKLPADKHVTEESDTQIPDSERLWPSNACSEKVFRPIIDPNIVNARAPEAAKLRHATELAIDSECENMVVILPRLLPKVKENIALLRVPLGNLVFTEVSENHSVLSALLCITLAEGDIN